MSKYFVALVASMLANFAFAATWYVSPDGTGDGSSWSAATTIETACSGIKNGDTMLMKAGTYPLSARLTGIPGGVTINGGLAGTDDETLALDPISILDAQYIVDMALYATTEAETTIIRRLSFVNATSHGFYKQPKGGLLEMYDCRFVNNATNYNLTGYTTSANTLTKTDSTFRGGRGALFLGTKASSVYLKNCIFEGNASINHPGSGYPYGSFGDGAMFSTLNRATMENCKFYLNGINFASTYKSIRTGSGAAFFAYKSPVTAIGCDFRANSQLVGFGDSGGICEVYTSDAISVFTNCLWMGNRVVREYQGSNGDSTSGIVLVRDSQPIDIVNSTIAYNISATKKWSAGLSVSAGNVNVKNTIIWGNKTAGGSTPDVYKAGTANINFTNVILGNSMDGTNVGVNDPLFVTTKSTFESYIKDMGQYTCGFNNQDAVMNFDAHLLSSVGYWDNAGVKHENEDVVDSPAIDAGDVIVDLKESSPNGGIVNLGRYGNTAEASLSKVGLPEIGDGDVAVTFRETGDGLNYAQPTINITTHKFKSLAEMTISGTRWDGATFEEIFSFSADPDVINSFEIKEFLKPGTEITISIKLSVSGFDPLIKEFSSEISTDVVIPEYAGYGSKLSNVVHYWTGAKGKGDGSSWLHACTSLNDAIRIMNNDETKTQLWIAGSNVLSVAVSGLVLNPIQECTVLGGFTEFCNTLSDREESAISVLDGNNVTVPFKVTNSVKVQFERIKFRKGNLCNFEKGGTGDLVFQKCEFADAKKSLNRNGGRFSGGGVAVLKFKSCRFFNNTATGSESNDNYSHGAYGAYFNNCKRVCFYDCQFAYNGSEYCSAQRGQYGGAAIYAESAPITAYNTRFEGNRNSMSFKDDYARGIVRLKGTVTEDSAFTNCVWVGNEDRNTISSGSKAPGGGMVSVEYTSAQRNVDFVNCTFAYNLVDGAAGSTAGISVLKGSANIVNSIFYGSVTGATCNAGKYLHVAAGATANVRNSLFESAEDISFVDSGSVTTKNLIYGDPLFIYSYDQFKSELLAAAGTSLNLATVLNKINNGQLNYHLSGAGYYDESGVITNRVKGVKSPAVDAGVKVGEFKEPVPNGNKVNLGFYGNTPGATLSAGGFIIIIR